MIPSRDLVHALEKTLRERIAYNVKKRREEQNLSLSKAAWLAGINRKSWVAIERSEATLPLRTVARVLLILEMDHIALMSESRPGYAGDEQPADQGAARGGA